MDKDKLKRFVMWPLSDSSMNRIFRKINVIPVNPSLEVRKATQQIPSAKNNNYKSVAKDDCPPSEHPIFLQKLQGSYVNPSYEPDAEVKMYLMPTSKRQWLKAQPRTAFFPEG